LEPAAAEDEGAENLWQWLSSAGRLKNPWTSVMKANIRVGNDCEIAAGSFIERNVIMEDGSGTATATRVAANAAIKAGTRVVGNPSSKLTLVTKKKVVNDPESSAIPQLSLVASMTLRNLLAMFHIAYLLAGVVTILEVIHNLPYPSHLEIEYTLPISMALAFALLLCLLAVEIVFVKYVFFGRTSTTSIPLQTFKGLVYHHLQVLGDPFEALVFLVFSGMYPVTMFYKLLGADIGHGVFLASYVDLGDANGTCIRPYSVLDEGCHCVCHRVEHGMLHQRTVLLNAGAVLHPAAVMMMGSLGRGSQLFPLSKALRETHTNDEQIFIGHPAVLAHADSADREEKVKSTVPPQPCDDDLPV